MKTYTYIRKTADSGESGQSTQQVIGETTSKYIAQEVDELVRKRLNMRAKPSTNSRPVIVIASEHPKFKVGQTFNSGREACRALGVSIQNLSTAFFRGYVDKDDCRVGSLYGVTFKQIKKHRGV